MLPAVESVAIDAILARTDFSIASDRMSQSGVSRIHDAFPDRSAACPSNYFTTEASLRICTIPQTLAIAIRVV